MKEKLEKLNNKQFQKQIIRKQIDHIELMLAKKPDDEELQEKLKDFKHKLSIFRGKC